MSEISTSEISTSEASTSEASTPKISTSETLMDVPIQVSAPIVPNVPQIRTWGTFTLLEESPHYRINRIEIKPGAVIGWQMHYHRSEHWIVVSGTAKVTCGNAEHLLQQKQSTYVPTSTPHKVENPGVIPLIMIEVQNGEYLGPEDIIRFDHDPRRI